MAKVMKKLSALLLAFAMMITMMPALALEANAESQNVFNVYVNGVDTGNGVTSEWLQENAMDAQVFPFASQQGKAWNYVAAEGPSYEAVLKETLGIESLDDISEAAINWNNDEGAEQGKFDLYIEDQKNATDQFKLVDQDGNDITGPFNGDDIVSAEAVAIDGAAELTPVVAFRNHSYAKYEEAVAALDNYAWTEGAASEVRPYVGGNLSKETFLKKDGSIKMGVVNFTGKFSMAKLPQLNVKLAAPDVQTMTFDTPDAEAQEAVLKYPLPDDILAALRANAVWESSDPAVATADAGIIKPVSAGTCTVTAKAKGVSETVLAKYEVTVNKPVTTVFSVYVNGKSLDKPITDKWLEENAMEAQVFPFASQQGKAWNYVVAEGPSYEAVLKETLGIESLDDIKHAAINWNNAEGAEQGKYDLYIEDLKNATDQFKLVDQDGNDITGGFTGAGIVSAEAVAIDGAAELTPVVAFRNHSYATYEEAVAALDNDTWKEGAVSEVRPYVGGNLGKETFLKKDGSVNMGVVNFTGKFSMAKLPQLNVKLAAETKETTLTFTKTTAKQVPATYTNKEIEFLGGVTWKSSNTKIAAVSSTGKVTPKGYGTCTVKAELSDGTVINKCSVTVKKSAFTPAVPGSFKAVNVKTRSAKLTWKKVSGATGYVVYRSRKKSSGFKRIATFKKNTTVRYTNKKLRKGRTYYYKIRAYRTVNGKTVYGKFTTVKAVKIKK